MGRILLLEPWMKEVIWGSDRLQRGFHKDFPYGKALGETWEISAIAGHESLLSGAGESLRTALDRDHALCGAAADDFPLLVKLLAPSQWLSVQVHPDDAQARHFGGPTARGKHEAWLILEADPGSFVYAGLEAGVTAADLAAALAAKDEVKVVEALRKVPVQVGDLIDVRPGTIHALGPGITLLEVQQPSDLTFRLFDWNRPGLDGKPRPLHLEEGLAVLDADSRPAVRASPGGVKGEAQARVAHEHFRIQTLEVAGQASFALDDFAAFVVTAGEGQLSLAGERTKTLRRGAAGIISRGVGPIQAFGVGFALALALPPLSTDS